jgi:septal ring factor EnvC (AmiA/AmiB activator)
VDFNSLLSGILPGAVMAVLSGFIAMKSSAAKTEVLIAEIKTSVEQNSRSTQDNRIAVEKRNTEMEGIHRELRDLKNVTDIHSREIAELHATLARMEAKLDVLVGGYDRKKGE